MPARWTITFRTCASSKIVELDTKARKLNLKVNDAELGRRRAQWQPPQKPARGYLRLYTERVTQAEQGCDFDFLSGTPVK
jgi:dihydroxyacid dehydratase/phosphogluconate dehydratase